MTTNLSVNVAHHLVSVFEYCGQGKHSGFIATISATLRNALRNVIRECSDADERKRIPPTPPDSILNATIWQRDDGYIMYSIEYEQAPVDDFG